MNLKGIFRSLENSIFNFSLVMYLRPFLIKMANSFLVTSISSEIVILKEIGYSDELLPICENQSLWFSLHKSNEYL